MSHGFGSIRSVMPTVHPTMNDLYWAAGFLEGEGSFSKCGKRDSASGHRMSANQVEPECLERLAAMFGGTVKKRVYRTPSFVGTRYENLHHKVMSSWEITGTLARGTMLTLYTMLSARRRMQIRRVFDAADTRRD